MNPTICPTVMADTTKDYKIQIERVSGFAKRIQVDLSDGKFAPHKTVGPKDAWWPVGIQADIHLMYELPEPVVSQLTQHNPRTIIVHAEAAMDFGRVAAILNENDIRVGMALLPHTALDGIWPQLQRCDHVMIFSGRLGEFGGHADLSLLEKAKQIKSRLPHVEVGWDGGINDQNVARLVAGGVDVLDVGGFLHHSPDPERTYRALQRVADETGTT